MLVSLVVFVQVGSLLIGPYFYGLVFLLILPVLYPAINASGAPPPTFHD